jgi:Helix-turn-helix domain
VSGQLSQRQLVLHLLSDGDWHSSIEFVAEGVLRAAARVFELRCEGFAIDSRRVEGRRGAPVYEYRLRQLSAQEELLVRRAQEALAEIEPEEPEPEQLRLDEEGAA